MATQLVPPPLGTVHDSQPVEAVEVEGNSGTASTRQTQQAEGPHKGNAKDNSYSGPCPGHHPVSQRQCNVSERACISGRRNLDSNPGLAVCELFPWANGITSLSLTILICEMRRKPLALPPSRALVGKGLWKCFASYAKVSRPKSWQFLVQQVLEMTGSFWPSPRSFSSSLTTCTITLRNIRAPCPAGLPPSFFSGPFLAGSFWKSTSPGCSHVVWPAPQARFQDPPPLGDCQNAISAVATQWKGKLEHAKPLSHSHQPLKSQTKKI